MTSRRLQRAEIASKRRPTAGKGKAQTPLDLKNGLIPNKTPHFESGKGDTIGGKKLPASDLHNLSTFAPPSDVAATRSNRAITERAASETKAATETERVRQGHIKGLADRQEKDFGDISMNRSQQLAKHIGEVSGRQVPIARKTNLKANPSLPGEAMGIPAAMPKSSSPAELKATKTAADAAAGERTANSGGTTRAGLYDPNNTSGGERKTHQQMRQFNKNKARRVRQAEKKSGLAAQLQTETDPAKKAELQTAHDAIKGEHLYSKSEVSTARALDRDSAAKSASSAVSANRKEERLSRQAESAGITPEELKARRAPSPARETLYSAASKMLQPSEESGRKTYTPEDIKPGPEKELEYVHRHLAIPKPHIKSLITKKYPQMSVRDGLSAMFSLRTNQTKHPKTGKTPWETLHAEAQEHSAAETTRASAQGRKNAATSRGNKRQNSALEAHETATAVAKMAGTEAPARPVHPGVAASERKNQIAADRSSGGPTSNQGARGPAFHAAAAFGGDVATPVKKAKFEEVKGPRPTVAVPNRPARKPKAK